MPTIDRRQVLSLLVTGTAASLAGCADDDDGDDGGDGGSGDGELGERVPTVTLEYWTAHRSTPFAERAAPLHQEYWEQLGIDVEIQPKEVAASVGEVWNDQRNFHVQQHSNSASPDRLDPLEMVNNSRIDYAGAGGLPNTSQIADCETTGYVMAQRRAATIEERQEFINRAYEKMSEEVFCIPQMPVVISGAYRSDLWDIDVGELGASTINHEPWATAEPVGDADELIAQVFPYHFERTNHFQLTNSSQPMWNSLVNSPLVGINADLEFENVLAETVEEEGDGRTFTFELRDGATFHNGDPITADAVKFTYEMMTDNADHFAYAADLEYDSIEAVDERTVEFTLSEPYAAFLTRDVPRWGILHPPTWDGVYDDPTGFEPDHDGYVGSGVFEIESIEPRRSMTFTPTDRHPVYEPDHAIIFRGFDEMTTAIEAFIAGEVHYVVDIGPGQIDRIEDSDIIDQAEIPTTTAFTSDPLYPQMNFGPTKFREFRDALGKCLDLEEINEVARDGMSEPEPYSINIMESHPFRPPEEYLYAPTTDTTGDIDAARQTLEDAGWGWDDDGRLHYPPDADLEPRWPAGESPTSEQGHDCLDEEGELRDEWIDEFVDSI